MIIIINTVLHNLYSTFSSHHFLLTVSRDVEQHVSNPTWGPYVRDLISIGLRQPRQGVDMGDHPPITPVASVDVNILPSGESALYEMITKHFLSTVSDGTLNDDDDTTINNNNNNNNNINEFFMNRL